MKNTTLSLILVLLVSACSHKTDGSATSSSIQFSIAASDVSAAVVLTRAGSTTAAVVDVHFSSSKAAEFRKFTEAHLNQQVQILVGTNVVAEPVIRAAITGGKVQLHFATREEAQAVADSLTKK
jgi:preprotein translocase subunit SecD